MTEPNLVPPDELDVELEQVDADIDDGPSSEHSCRRARVDDGDVWRSSLDYTKQTGEITKTLGNAVVILREHPEWRGVLAYDAFAERVITTRPPPWTPTERPAHTTTGEVSDADSSRVAIWLHRREGLKLGREIVDQAIAVAAESTIVHPVRDYLLALKWDAKQRLPSMLSDYFGCEGDGAFLSAIGTRWMISAVARILRPGCQADCVLVLEGAQGERKSTGLEALASPEWFADSGVVIGDKDSYQALHGKWIYELGELASVTRSTLEKTKAWISARSDHYRPSYGRRARDFPRQNVFAATTNAEEYLTDTTGNRRWWPGRVRHRVDVEAIRRDRDQLWAEARARFESGEKWYLDSDELVAKAEAEQGDRTQTEPWAELVAAWLLDPRRYSETGAYEGERFDLSRGVSTAEVCLGALRMRPGDLTRAAEMRAADVLRALGYARARQTTEPSGRRIRRYLKEQP